MLVAECLSLDACCWMLVAGCLLLDACCSSVGVAGVSRPIFGQIIADWCQNMFYKHGINGQNSRPSGEKMLDMKTEMGRSIKRSCSTGEKRDVSPEEIGHSEGKFTGKGDY